MHLLLSTETTTSFMSFHGQARRHLPGQLHVAPHPACCAAGMPDPLGPAYLFETLHLDEGRTPGAARHICHWLGRHRASCCCTLTPIIPFYQFWKPSEGAHPRCPATTRYIFQGACQAGRGHLLGRRRASCALGTYSFCSPDAVGTSARVPWCNTSAPAAAAAARAALLRQRGSGQNPNAVEQEYGVRNHGTLPASPGAAPARPPPPPPYAPPCSASEGQGGSLQDDSASRWSVPDAIAVPTHAG